MKEALAVQVEGMRHCYDVAKKVDASLDSNLTMTLALGVTETGQGLEVRSLTTDVDGGSSALTGCLLGLFDRVRFEGVRGQVVSTKMDLNPAPEG